MKLHQPGSVHGPCEEGCDHDGCRLLKAHADRKCQKCGQTIGFDVDVTFLVEDVAHTKCLTGEEPSPEGEQTTSKMC